MREDNGQVDGRIAMRLDQKLPEIPIMYVRLLFRAAHRLPPLLFLIAQ